MTQWENKSQKDDSTSYNGDLPQELHQSTNLNSRKGLIRRLRKGRPARIKFVESHLNKKLAFQIRSLRGELSQEQMEAKVGLKQQALSRLENPYYGKATLTTLKKLAAGCDVGLLVEFVPFSQLINRVSGTPYIEHGFSPETMNVPDFDEEEKQGKFSDDRKEIPTTREASDSAEAMLGKLREMTVPAQNVVTSLFDSLVNKALAAHLGGTVGNVPSLEKEIGESFSTIPSRTYESGARTLHFGERQRTLTPVERIKGKESQTPRRRTSAGRRGIRRNERRRIYG
jgi:transcriptional regulator with XRE-family HTH domain